VTDNIISLYAQASNRLGLKEEEIEVIERMLDRKDFELHVIEQLRQIQSVTAKPQILNVAVIAAAASCLTVCDGQHACLQRISNALGVPYGQADLIAIIEYLKR
ncbi:MAG TPA: hypothetical protein VIS99_11830, partial [Terrimicrobiaceae bacterium]